MKIAIAERKGSYSDHWIAYCKEHNIPYKCVNPYDTDIVAQVADCDAFMWHHHQGHYRDVLFAKQLLFSLEEAGKVVFPDFKTGWHFDDKLGQKYLFESLGIPAAKAWAFYDKESAYKWIEQATFPKVFKLRGGAGSANVKLARTDREARSFIQKVFGSGYKASSSVFAARYEWKKFTSERGGIKSFFKAIKYTIITLFPRVFFFPASIKNRVYLPDQKGYAYFQDFIPNDGFDYRLEIVDNKAIAMVRMARPGDFRASGGHDDHFDSNLIPKNVIDFAFECYDKLGVQSVALDIVQEKDTNNLYLIEVSYCYGVDDDEFAHGYWTRDGNHHQEPFNGIHWMIEKVIDTIEHDKKR